MSRQHSCPDTVAGTEVEPLFRLAELAKMTKEQRISEEGRAEVSLKRPFAQLNVGTSPEDFEAARAAGLAPVSGTENNKDVTFTLYEGNPEEGDAVELVSYTQANVWFRANYRTNLIGNLLTADGGIEVFVSPIFDGEAK